MLSMGTNSKIVIFYDIKNRNLVTLVKKMINLFINYFYNYTKINKNLNLIKFSWHYPKKESIRILKLLDKDKIYNITYHNLSLI